MELYKPIVWCVILFPFPFGYRWPTQPGLSIYRQSACLLYWQGLKIRILPTSSLWIRWGLTSWLWWLEAALFWSKSNRPFMTETRGEKSSVECQQSFKLDCMHFGGRGGEDLSHFPAVPPHDWKQKKCCFAEAKGWQSETVSIHCKGLDQDNAEGWFVLGGWEVLCSQ